MKEFVCGGNCHCDINGLLDCEGFANCDSSTVESICRLSGSCKCTWVEDGDG